MFGVHWPSTGSDVVDNKWTDDQIHYTQLPLTKKCQLS